MKNVPQKLERIHSFDLLRATIMFLVIIAHSALTYTRTAQKAIWPIKDPKSNNAVCDLIVYLIYSWTMPVFYITAGFFGAMLFYKKAPSEMVKNRMLRLVFPFVVFLIILYPIIVFSFAYTKAVFSGSSDAFAIAAAPFSDLSAFFPRATYHLWFLYYLIYLTFITAAIAFVLKGKRDLTVAILKPFNWVFQRPFLRVFFFSAVTFCILLGFNRSIVPEKPVTLVPDVELIVYYSVFYLIGWLLFKSKHLLDTMMNYASFFAIAGLVMIMTKAAMIQFLSPDMEQNIRAKEVIAVGELSVWLLTFGITGLFMRYGSKPSALLRYVSDASYWVYFIHIPFTLLIPAFIFKWPAPTLCKFLVVLVVTTFICFFTYHYLVRATFIGKFLNGRKYPRKIKSEPSVRMAEVETQGS